MLSTRHPFQLSSRFLFLAVFALLALPAFVSAQSSEYQISLRRTFGYSAGIDIRGSFSLNIVGDKETIRSVTYRMDQQELAVIREAPFQLSLKTSDYPSGKHVFDAIVETSDSRQVTTPAVTFNFLSAGEETQGMQRILIPMVIGIGLALLIGIGLQVFLLRRKDPLAPGAARSYGIKGGAICPRCGRPFAIHFFSINLIGGYLDRCDHCGRFGFVRRSSPQALAAAEQAELSSAQAGENSLPGVQEESEEERLQKMLDESKYSS